MWAYDNIKFCFLEYISDIGPLIQTVYKWQEEQWGPEGVFIFAGSIKTIIAIKDKKPIGCAALVNCDLPSVEGLNKLTPWLAGVYVIPEERNKGIASELISNIENIARKLEYKKMYLYSFHIKFYENKGWNCVCKFPNTEEYVMHKEL